MTLPDSSPIIDFYRGTGRGAGRTFEQVVALDNIALEYGHDWVQWVFPLPEPSKAQPQSPVMTEADLQVFREDPEIRARIYTALLRFWRFLMETHRWHRAHDHNHLRITRVLRFLTLTWFHTEAKDIYHWVETDKRCEAPERTREFWREALNVKPAWLFGGTP